MGYGAEGGTQTRSTLTEHFRTVPHFIDDFVRVLFYTVHTLYTRSTPLCLSCDRHSRPVVDRYIYNILYRLRPLSCSR
jgi:hypothetical protein